MAGMVIHAFVRFCMILNPTMCRELEIAPIDQAITLPLCMRGVMMGNQAEFDMDGARWRIFGGVCKPVPAITTEIQARLRAGVSD